MKALLLAVLVMGLATGQEPPPQAVEVQEEWLIQGLPPGPPPPPSTVDETTKRLALGLRCPVCQGLSIGDSSSSAAVMIQNRIREMVAAGYTEDQIRDYFVQKYGEWILLEPPAQGLNWLIWLGPLLAGGGGVIWLLASMGRRRSKEDTGSSEAAVDPYEEKLLSEMKE
ncbi:MAG: cytochrome c-type biogenesis protein CcmH [Proteobacteria bacterium]|jgi:cytochrome c-type biogenesis protein CcmH|nr:cytochrome c-type biogenesis protein CcmH [Pseudomonadota bacterium]